MGGWIDERTTSFQALALGRETCATAPTSHCGLWAIRLALLVAEAGKASTFTNPVG